jgi:hypothetical protein
MKNMMKNFIRSKSMKKLIAAMLCAAIAALGGCSLPLEGIGVKPAATVPVLTPEAYLSISVSWEAATFAESYNVYCAESETRPETPYRSDITGTSASITGLTNGTTYYVWVEAVNPRGGKMSDPASSIPGPSVGGVYVVPSASVFTQVLAMINASQAAENYITLTGDITVAAVSFPASGMEKTITIRGDASLRTISNGGDSDLFTVESGNTLVLENNIKLNGNDKSYNAVQVNAGGNLVMRAGSAIEGASSNAVYINGGVFTMSGGEISGNTADYGGGVYVDDSSTFTMSGGEISGNTADYGGGVYVDGSSSTFTMSGGEISGNTADYGGGIYVDGSSTFTMSDGTISGNTAGDSGGGGGVYVGSSTFTMSGGEISGNTISFNGGGGGVYVDDSSTFTMSDGTISGNTAGRGDGSGGGVYVSGTFTMSGGEISGNTAAGSYSNGGGVYVGDSSTFMMSGGEISGNTVGGDGGGVYANSTFTMSGGEISGNTARRGGGVYVTGRGHFTKNGGGTISGTNSPNVAYVMYGFTRTTEAGPGVDMDSSKSGSAGGWD